MKREEIIYAKKVMRTMHPLYNLEIEVCLPFLDPVIGVTRRCFQRVGWSQPQQAANAEERTGLADADGLKSDSAGLERADLELADGERGPDEPLFDFFLDEGEDAMTRLGYGIVSYFGIIYTFMMVFGLITLINIPVMYNNSSWSAFANLKQLSWTAQYTAGNLGQSQARCLGVKMLSDSVSISCPTGEIGEITHVGVYGKDSEADQRALCTSEGVSVSTGLSCDSISRKDHSFREEKLAPCIGQQSCLVHGIHDEIPLGSQPGDGGCSI